MRLAFRIALRFLLSNKGQTLLIALGIAVGISVQIFIGSLIEGLQASLIDATIGRSPHVQIVSDEKTEPLDQYVPISRWLKERFPEITAISPVVSGGGFLDDGDNTDQVLLRGIDLDSANSIYRFEEALASGVLETGSDEIVIGYDLARENELSLGTWVDLVTPNGERHSLKIVGIFDLKVTALNKSWVLTDMDTARKILNLEDWQVSALEMQISEPFKADEVAKRMSVLREKYPSKTTNWKADNAQLLSGLSGQGTSSLMIQVFVVISVVLGIASVLAISVLQKSKQLGILKAMGISDGNASLVFLFQGFLLGILGGLFGIALGMGLLWSFSKFALRPDGTPVVPILINYRFIALSGMIAVMASTLASVLPAAKSRKLSPIEVIKNG